MVVALDALVGGCGDSQAANIRKRLGREVRLQEIMVGRVGLEPTTKGL